jgi:uncharacterized Zn finger protein
MMPTFHLQSFPCPQCGSAELSVLPFSTELASYVLYLQCSKCGHVWLQPKQGDEASSAPIVQHVG